MTELTCSSYLTIDGVCVRMRVRTSSVYVYDMYVVFQSLHLLANLPTVVALPWRELFGFLSLHVINAYPMYVDVLRSRRDASSRAHAPAHYH